MSCHISPCYCSGCYYSLAKMLYIDGLDDSGGGQRRVQSTQNPILDSKKHKANSMHELVRSNGQAKCINFYRKSIHAVWL